MNDKDRNKIIASNIKGYIKLHKITQKQLAESIGLSPSTMSDYMNLRSNPSHGVIQKIADYFGILKSDIDTTYKENSQISSIETIYNKLDGDRQTKVVNFAQEQLDEQNNNVLPLYRTKAADDVGTFAAHSVEDGKQFTDEEIAEADAYLQKLQEKFENKHKK